MSAANLTSLSPTEMLYANANTDFLQLTWLELQWASFYIWVGTPFIATGLMSFALHEIVYFGRCIPWVIIDALPYFRRWKLQPTKIPTVAEQWDCTKQVLLSHFTIEAPAIWFFHPVAEFFGMMTWQVPFPTWQAMLPQILYFFVFEDTFHYFAHSALHWGPLYKYIHKIHHKYSAPFGLAAEYAHPAEVGILALGTLLGPISYCAFRSDFHIFTMYVWITLRLFQAVDAHSGYDFPWSLQHILPFWSGAEHHDFHHMAFVNNFSTSFRWWDSLFGTDQKYKAYRARKNAAKKANMTDKDMLEMERQLAAEVEAEGIRAEQEVVDYAKTKTA